MVDVPFDGDLAISGSGRCPICRRASDPVLRPFCSKRCADVDLHRWLAGTYAIPADKDDEEDATLDDTDGSET